MRRLRHGLLDHFAYAPGDVPAERRSPRSGAASDTSTATTGGTGGFLLRALPVGRDAHGSRTYQGGSRIRSSITRQFTGQPSLTWETGPLPADMGVDCEHVADPMLTAWSG